MARTQEAVTQTVVASSRLLTAANLPPLEVNRITEYTVAVLATVATAVGTGVVTAVTTTAACVTDPERHLPPALFELLNTNVTLALPAGLHIDRGEADADADAEPSERETDVLTVLQTGANAAAAVVWSRVNERLQTLVDGVDTGSGAIPATTPVSSIVAPEVSVGAPAVTPAQAARPPPARPPPTGPPVFSTPSFVVPPASQPHSSLDDSAIELELDDLPSACDGINQDV